MLSFQFILIFFKKSDKNNLQFKNLFSEKNFQSLKLLIRKSWEKHMDSVLYKRSLNLNNSSKLDWINRLSLEGFNPHYIE
jgi:hypothetical protein